MIWENWIRPWMMIRHQIVVVEIFKSFAKQRLSSCFEMKSMRFVYVLSALYLFLFCLLDDRTKRKTKTEQKQRASTFLHTQDDANDKERAKKRADIFQFSFISFNLQAPPYLPHRTFINTRPLIHWFRIFYWNTTRKRWKMCLRI